MQRKVIIFGNSGSGKSTLAKKIAESEGLAHLDLDTIAWKPSSPPQRESLDKSAQYIKQFITENQAWVIEGCYSDLLELVSPHANEAIFLNLSTQACIENARNRPWEPHKYKTKQDQDNNLQMLIDWIKQYYDREDVFSLSAHRKLFDNFTGHKTERNENQ